MPAAILCNEPICCFRSPTALLIWESSMMILQHRIDYRPGSLYSILTGKEHAIARHGIFQQSLVRQSLSALFLNHGELVLLTNKFFPFVFHPRGECDSGIRGKL